MRWLGHKSSQENIAPAHWRAMLIAFTASIFPLVFFLPAQYLLLFAASVIVRALTLPRSRQRLATLALLLFVPIALLLIYVELHQRSFTHSFLILLTAMGCAKLLETRSYRDCRVLFLLMLLQLLACLMFSQSVWLFFYTIGACGLSIWALLQVEHRHSHMVGLGRWQDLLKLLGVSLPITLALFFLFPRIDPLWHMPRQPSKHITGLPEQMGMGDISSLAQSNAIAFRVKFADEAIPANDKLYWRGPVLWFFDGQNWRQWAEDFKQPPAQFYYQQDSAVHYEVMPAKKNLDWLLALDLPVRTPQTAQMGRAYQLKLPANQAAMTRYQLTSALAYRNDSLTSKERRAALYLPNEIPKTTALAQQIWQTHGKTTAGFVQGFLQYLREEPFYYSLEPPPGAGDVETFLFDKGRIGFCEHYANAFAQAARSVGIPSRVVLGYQGGERNPLNGDFLVREESAHAWVEIWFDESGWQRVDPTAAVAPERILQARLSGDALTYGDDSRAFGSRVAERLSAFAWARNFVDYSQAFWQDWVVGLNKERQNSLFNWSGISSLGNSIILMLIILGGWVLTSVLMFYWHRRAGNHASVLTRALDKLLGRLKAKGYHRLATESVSAFLLRIAVEFPEPMRRQLREIAIRYERVRYHENENENTLIHVLKRTKI